MRIQRILKELEFNDGTFPRQALEAAIASREQIIPELLKIVQDTTQRANVLLHQHNYMAHFYALYLLAQFREKRAYPLIVDLFSIPGEIALDLTGSIVTEDLDRILASVSCGDTSLIMSLAENENANEYVRNAALRGLVVLVACGEKSRKEVMAYYQSLFQKLPREYSYAWSGLVNCSTDLYPEEVYEDIKQAFNDNLIDSFSIDLEFVQETLALGKEKVLAKLQDQRHSLIEDTIKEMEWWACFKAPKRRSVVEKKVGRNKPCPCGSGKKYKHCCGARR